MKNPIAHWLLPNEIDLVLHHSFNAQGWIIENLSFYDTQWIQCSYPPSGGYAPTTRYIYYVFVLVALFGRKSDWLTNAALGLVMTLSSAAAIHGIILAIIRRDLVPDYLLENDDWEVLQVDGPTFVNHLTDGRLYNQTTKETWLQVIPMVWERDGDAILAIVGVAFLVLLPMQTWSTTLHNTMRAKKVLIGIWSCLLFSGLFSALIYVEFALIWTAPQFRFCPPGAADTLPFNSKGPYTYPSNRSAGDWYRWNRIVGEQYVYKNASTRLPDVCLYPCLEFEWLLRDPEDIHVTESMPGFTDAAWRALAAIYFIVASSCICNICLLLTTLTNVLTNAQWGLDPTLIELIREHKFIAVLKQAWKKRTPKVSPLQRMWREVVAFGFWYVSLFAILMSPVTILAFIGCCEWLLWTHDSGAESFRHVGQWGALLGAVLVIAYGGGSRFVGWLFMRYRRPTQLGDSRSWWRH